MTHFTPWSALAGGALIAMALGAMLLLTGRIAGISGIAGGLLRGTRGDFLWRAAFVAGMLAAGVAMARWLPGAFDTGHPATTSVLVAAGILVGIGTRLANGCTSGHGLCGTSRLSPRSLAATATFVSVGIATAVLARHALGILR